MCWTVYWLYMLDYYQSYTGFRWKKTKKNGSSCTNENLLVGGGFSLKIGPRGFLPMEGGIILQQEVKIPIAGWWFLVKEEIFSRRRNPSLSQEDFLGRNFISRRADRFSECRWIFLIIAIISFLKSIRNIRNRKIQRPKFQNSHSHPLRYFKLSKGLEVEYWIIWTWQEVLYRTET